MGVEQTGTIFFGFAPSASASRDVMHKEGFAKSETLARLLVDRDLQQRIKNSVIWVDEAGLIGNSDMVALFKIAQEQKARILLTGDVNQHGSVKAGDALRILEKEGGIKVARVNEIQRQRNNPRFKKVIAEISKGEVDSALYRLDRMGGVMEIAEAEHRKQALIQNYLLAVKAKKSVLIISPTHKEGRQVTDALRAPA